MGENWVGSQFFNPPSSRENMLAVILKAGLNHANSGFTNEIKFVGNSTWNQAACFVRVCLRFNPNNIVPFLGSMSLQNQRPRGDAQKPPEKSRDWKNSAYLHNIHYIGYTCVYSVYIYTYVCIYIYVYMYVCIYIYVCTVYTRNILELMLRIPIVDRKIAPWWRQSQPRPRRFTHGVSPRKMIYGYPVSSMLGTTPAWHTFHSCYMILYLRFYENRCKFPKDSWCNSHQCTLYIYIYHICIMILNQFESYEIEYNIYVMILIWSCFCSISNKVCIYIYVYNIYII